MKHMSPSVNGFPHTRVSVLHEAGNNEWERFWDAYLAPSLREIGFELRRLGLYQIEPEELLVHLFCAISQPGKFQANYQALLAKSGLDPAFAGNLPAKFCYLLQAEGDGAVGSRARFRTLLRRVIRRSVVAGIRQLVGRRTESNGLSQDLDRPANEVDPGGDGWSDRIWIVGILCATTKAFFESCDGASTKAPKRFPRLLYLSLVEELSRNEIAHRIGIDPSNVSRYLEQAEQAFSACLKSQYPPEDEMDVQSALSGQDAGLIAATFRDEYLARYGSAPS
jgi:DNA-directed RNA polymerase specialized sigma24 family protein